MLIHVDSCIPLGLHVTNGKHGLGTHGFLPGFVTCGTLELLATFPELSCTILLVFIEFSSISKEENVSQKSFSVSLNRFPSLKLEIRSSPIRSKH